MGCDFYNDGKTLTITFTDYDTGREIYSTTIDVSCVKRIECEIFGDGLKER